MVFIHVARVDTKPEFVRKFIAAASMLAGVAWIGFATAFPLIRFLTEDKEPFDWIFAVTMLPLMAIPGAIGLFYGRRLFLRFDETSVKYLCGTLAVLGAFQISALLETGLPRRFPQRLGSQLYLMIGVMFAIPAYFFTVKAILPLVGGERRKIRELISRNMIGLIAFLLWGLLSELIETFAPKDPEYPNLVADPWVFLSLIIPILVPIILYKIAVSFLPSEPVIAGVSDKKHRSFRLS